jgi:hypothetical protein
MQKFLLFCDYVRGICDSDSDGRLLRIESHIERNNASFLTKNVLEDHIQNYESFENLLNQFKNDVNAGIARFDKKSGDPVDVGGEEWDCKKVVELIDETKGKIPKNGQRRNVASKQISKYATDVQRGVLAVIEGLLAKVSSFKKGATGGLGDYSDNDEYGSEDSDVDDLGLSTSSINLQEIEYKMPNMKDASLKESLLRFFSDQLSSTVENIRNNGGDGSNHPRPMFSKSAMSAADEKSLVNIQAHALENSYGCTLRVLSAFEDCRPYFHSLKPTGGDWILTPNATTSNSITSSPLWWACTTNNFPVVEALIGKRDMSHRMRDLYDPLYPDPTKSNHSCEHVHKLLQEHHFHNLHLKNVLGQTLAEVVAEQGDRASPVLELLISHDPSIVEVYTCPEKELALLGLFDRMNAPAAKCTHRVVDLILGNSPRWATFRLGDGNMIAHWACKNGNPLVLQSLLLPKHIRYVLTENKSALVPDNIPKVDAREANRRFAYQVVARDHTREGDNLIALFLQARNINVLDQELFCKIFAISARMACNHPEDAPPSGDNILAWLEYKYKIAVEKWENFIKNQWGDITDTDSAGGWTTFYRKYAERRNEMGRNLSDLHPNNGGGHSVARWTLVGKLLMGNETFFSTANIRKRNSAELSEFTPENGIENMKRVMKEQSWCKLSDLDLDD